MAAFAADPFLKYVVMVHQDVNILNDEEVLHAIATRVRADTDIFMVTHAKGSPLVGFKFKRPVSSEMGPFRLFMTFV